MVRIVDINEENIDEEELFCKKTKKKFLGYQNKVKWIKERFKEGLKYKLLYVKEGNNETSRGMIEYIPGEYNWRGIKADGWMVIHCLWVVGKHKKKGYGSNLINECIKDAKGKLGVAVVASDDSFLVSKDVFLKNGFKIIAEDGKQQLLVKQLKKGKLPKFKDNKKNE